MGALHNLPVLVLPFLACLVLVGIHGYLGIHVIARKVIFVDLAMAQIAALGGTVAFLLGHDLHSLTAYFVSLGFTLAGAAVFAITRTKHEKVPQEAIIGLVYAIATATAIVLSDAAHKGDEHLKALLSGSIVWVTKRQLFKTACIYAVVGAFHFVFRRQFLAISFDIEKARTDGLHVRLWDFFFYLSFGFVITSSVSIAGVLLVFCYLIAPAVAATLFAESIRARLTIAWVLGTVVSAVGILFSFDRPSGPTIICFFAAVLLVAGLGKAIYASKNRLRTVAFIAAGCLLVPGIVWSLVHFLKQEGEEDRELK
ncbi:MAG: metal ABC transporter permease, partial [Planctomycetes bacterium]|nr:metal ABC transporter permease [Planctomycetota bacterium]